MYGAMYAGHCGTALSPWYFGLRAHSVEIEGQNMSRPLFLVFWFIRVVETLLVGEEVYLFGICGLVGPDILVQVLQVSLWRSPMLVGGSRM